MRGSRRNPLVQIILLALPCLLGIGSRRYAQVLPGFIAAYAGDTLWALAAFLGIGLVLSRASTRTIACLAMSFSVAVEISQLYHAPWIDSIRQTTLGGLILGFAFLWSDLASYAVGVGLGVMIDIGVSAPPVPPQRSPKGSSLLRTPMTEKLKAFAARHVFHPLQGMTLGDWWALLRRHRFAVDLQHSPRALVQTAFSVSNSINARIERWRFGRRIEAAQVQAPLFILGHYRSGTTHLHNLLALDPQFAAPTLFQVFNPHTFLTTERLAAPVADSIIARRRYQDEMAQGAGMPSEDEFALCTMTGLSPYMAWCFPGDGVDYERYLTFRGVPHEEVARWKHALTTLLKKLSVRFSRSLIVKSPPHTARIRLLLGLFPDARFVHIHRNPYDVFRSARHTMRVVQPLYHLREGPLEDGIDRIISVYTEMYDAYFEERELISEGRLCDVGYEDLGRDPIGVVGSIYESLGLSGFEELRPRLESYLASVAGYRKNRHEELPEPLRRRIAHDWGRGFDEWGYGR